MLLLLQIPRPVRSFCSFFSNPPVDECSTLCRATGSCVSKVCPSRPACSSLVLLALGQAVQFLSSALLLFANSANPCRGCAPLYEKSLLLVSLFERFAPASHISTVALLQVLKFSCSFNFLVCFGRSCSSFSDLLILFDWSALLPTLFRILLIVKLCSLCWVVCFCFSESFLRPFQLVLLLVRKFSCRPSCFAPFLKLSSSCSLVSRLGRTNVPFKFKSLSKPRV